MLLKMQHCKERHFQSLTSSSQPIPLRKVKIKTITATLGQDCIKTLRKISKALFKVYLEDRVAVGNGTRWKIIFFKITASGRQDFAINWKFSLCFAEVYIYVSNCISDDVIPNERKPICDECVLF